MSWSTLLTGKLAGASQKSEGKIKSYVRVFFFNIYPKDVLKQCLCTSISKKRTLWQRSKIECDFIVRIDVNKTAWWCSQKLILVSQGLDSLICFIRKTPNICRVALRIAKTHRFWVRGWPKAHFACLLDNVHTRTVAAR